MAGSDSLNGKAISDTYKDLLQVPNANSGVDGTLRTVMDGEGTESTLQVSTAGVKSTGTLESTGNLTVGGTLTLGGTAISSLEDGADVTDAANVTAAGALMDSELTDLAGVKGVTISTLQPKPSEGAFVDGDKTKLDAIEASADVTDATNVTAAGALMDSELTDLAGVKGVTISTLQPKPSEGAFADGDKTKLDGITASANNYSHPDHSGEVTSTADGATVIADNVVDEANLKVSNTPTDGYSLVARSGETGGLKWESVSGGGGGGSGTVTQVDGAGTVSGLTLTGTVTSSGSLTLGGTLSADLTSDVTGTLPAANGGTGLTAITTLLNSNTTASDVGLGSVEDTAISTWAGSSNVTTLGTVGTGTWQGTAIADSYVASASTWNAKQAALTFGIANTNAVQINSADVADDEYARFTASGLESRSTAEVLSDIGAAASAHAHSAYAEKASSNTWSAAQQGNTQTAAFSALSSGVLDFDTYQNFVITLGAGTNAFTNPTTDSGNTGQTGVIVLIQDSSASTATWTSDYKNVGGSAPTLSSGSAKVDVLPYIIQADNTILLGAPQLDFS